jgi:hypothetical protein
MNCKQFAKRITVVNPLDADSCWNWTGVVKSNGYPRFQEHINGKWIATYAHRFSYETFVAPIPPGLVVDHICCNTKCVYPGHLQVITNEMNVSLMNARRVQR